MRFIYADSLDMVDPRYDFVRDQTASDRKIHTDDAFAHEMLEAAPYDGLLLSYATVGGVCETGTRVTFSRRMRLLREGMRRFYRLTEPQYRDLWLMGDCGAFSYAAESEPRYGVDEILTYYEESAVTHGCSVDHVIFEHERGRMDAGGGTDEARRRFAITLDRAESFLTGSAGLGPHFTPMGTVQGWSPGSMAAAARSLVKMGYRFLALGGMVPLKAHEILEAVSAVHEAAPDVRLHVLGCAKVEIAQDLARLGVVSMDSSTPVVRAFKDARKNYYLAKPTGDLEAYTAIRIASVLESPALVNLARMGLGNQEAMQALERRALTGLRRYGEREIDVAATMQTLVDFQDHLIDRTSERYLRSSISVPGEASGKGMLERYRRTLEERPWDRCGCRICRQAGIHVMLYRGVQLNRRRGFHNMTAFHQAIRMQCSSEDLPIDGRSGSEKNVAAGKAA
jgi:hypothetical protein